MKCSGGLFGAHRTLVLVGKPEGKEPRGRPRLDGRIILKLSSRSRIGVWTGFVWLRVGTYGGPL